jgi:hypothetical protein
MNMIPHIGFWQPVMCLKTRATKLNALNKHKREVHHADRRHNNERRQQSHFLYKSEMEMRQIGDRRRSKRLFVTT